MSGKLNLLLDIGTTTVSGAILDIDKNRLLASGFVLNGQIKVGDDLISRIDFALKSPSNFELLQSLVTSSINKLVKSLLIESGKKTKDIEETFSVCNTAMHHIFLGVNPASLITPPYRAAQKSEMRVCADRIGLKLRKNSFVTFLPNIESFIGSDALAVILSSGIYKSKAIKLAIDIGTNGEIILGNKDKILVTSTAAGPAFEGRHISCGMPAKNGAIESVAAGKKKIKIGVIGKVSPKGISGSGLIDAVSAMLKISAMDGSGKMKNQEFLVYGKGKSKIAITQADIRKIQLAKGAIYAAVKVLLRRYNISEAGLKEVLVTGSFGSSLNSKSMLNIGIIPKVPQKKVKILKQGALEGLRMYATRPEIHARLLSILSQIRHIPLFGRGFSDDFTSSLFIGQN